MGILDYIRKQKENFRVKQEQATNQRELQAQVRFEQQKQELEALKVQNKIYADRKKVQEQLVKEKAKLQTYQEPSSRNKLASGLKKFRQFQKERAEIRAARGGGIIADPFGRDKVTIVDKKGKRQIVKQDNEPSTGFGGKPW